jgi:hypothetical protein
MGYHHSHLGLDQVDFEPPKTEKPGAASSDLGSDRVKPWTIKGIAPGRAKRSVAAAQRADMSIGQWLTRAIRTPSAP